MGALGTPEISFRKDIAPREKDGLRSKFSRQALGEPRDSRVGAEDNNSRYGGGTGSQARTLDFPNEVVEPGADGLRLGFFAQ